MTSTKLIVAAVAGLATLSACARDYPGTNVPDGVYDLARATQASKEAHANIGDAKASAFPDKSHHKYLGEHRQALYFESGKANLSKEHEKTLQALVNRADAYAKYQIMIVAHADAVGDEEKNMDLAKERFLSVTDFLMSKSVDQSAIVARVEGEDTPAVVGDSDYRHKRNRRVELYLVLDKSEYEPGFRVDAP